MVVTRRIELPMNCGSINHFCIVATWINGMKIVMTLSSMYRINRNGAIAIPVAIIIISLVVYLRFIALID